MGENKGVLKPAMNYGAMLGIVLVALSLILYLVGLQTSTAGGVIPYLLIAAGVYYSQNHFKNNVLGGYMGYGKALGLGTLTCIFAGVISAFYLYIFLSFIDQGMIDQAMRESYDSMMEQGMEEEQINQAMKISEKFMTPGSMAFLGFLANAFFGFLISLAVSIFTKKEDPNA